MNKIKALTTTLCATLFSFFIQGQSVNLSNYELDWSDEFNGLDSDFDGKWISENGTPADSWHLASRWRENVKIADGILEITNKKENRGGKQWTSGSVWTKKQFTYGYFEARYRYAAATGTNNSFWLWPRTGSPAGEDRYEIDINEGHYPNQIATNVHNWSDTWVVNGNTKHPVDSEHFDYPNENLGNDYHVYGLEWTPTVMNFYFDNQLIRSVTNSTNHGSTNIMFSLAILSLPSFVGPVTDAIDGTSMKVSYVRYYKPKTRSNGNQKAQFYIVNKATGKKLRVSNKTNGATINQGDASWVGLQNVWEQIPTNNGYFHLKNVYNDMYFRPKTNADLSLLIQRPSANKYTQWRRVTSDDDGYYFLENRETGKYFRGVSDQNFAEIEQRPSSLFWQSSRWKFVPAPTNNRSGAKIVSTTDELGSEDNLTIYPNPATDEVYFSTETQSYDVEIFDVNGKLVKEFSVADNSIKEFTNKDLSAGVYIVKYQSETASKIKKLVIN
ncbi:family 16 glycosylhydrolase [Aquimarina agarivorans]|uniref:family 16 glycosylhydrolase n=1 Tax=Aquimarina agarivorans TaxID=980584 RepID=UPI000248F26F|nr:family 16 glycosylhydrolase [Aquimarina agarivorans]